MLNTPEAKAALDEYLLAVGQLCNMWGWLENTVGDTFIQIARLETSETTYAMVRCIDFRDQLSAVRIGAVTRSENTEWVNAIVGTIDYIDNYLRTRRNRFVHDQWMYSADEAVISVNYSPRSFERKREPRERFSMPKSQDGIFGT